MSEGDVKASNLLLDGGRSAASGGLSRRVERVCAREGALLGKIFSTKEGVHAFGSRRWWRRRDEIHIHGPRDIEASDVGALLQEHGLTGPLVGKPARSAGCSPIVVLHDGFANRQEESGPSVTNKIFDIGTAVRPLRRREHVHARRDVDANPRRRRLKPVITKRWASSISGICRNPAVWR